MLPLILQEYCRNATEMLYEYCGNTAITLQEYGRNAVGMLQESIRNDARICRNMLEIEAFWARGCDLMVWSATSVGAPLFNFFRMEKRR